MRVAVLALLIIPGVLAAAMLAAVIPAGDWLDDSPLLMLGLPAVISCAITFAVECGRRGPGRAVGWGIASGFAAVVQFGVFFVAAVAVDCAGRVGSCS
jgi:hypothetical protein